MLELQVESSKLGTSKEVLGTSKEVPREVNSKERRSDMLAASDAGEMTRHFHMRSFR